ncbi:metallophosphoesterase [Bacillus cereus]|uniref:metallophosphoesterase n=1 Tax=Bacillus cereus TaxID=1396 RepID=UPI000B4B09A9|nr:metallophosphoesterase [Bacillus cereus]
MRILVCNDMHLDINSNYLGRNLLPEFIEALKKKKPDLIIIPGDITDFADQTIKILEVIEKNVGVKVLFVPGNHDVWVDNTESSWDSYKLFADHSTTLIGKPYHINDEYVVVGDMGWYDYSFAPESIPFNTMRSRKKTLWQDGKFVRWGMDDPELMQKQMNAIQKGLEANRDKKVIFVNHFVPYKDFITYKSSDAEWNLCNGFMGSGNLGWLLDQFDNIEYVLFGHTHTRYGIIEDYRGKKVICNPIGYVGEWDSADFMEELENNIVLIEL